MGWNTLNYMKKLLCLIKHTFSKWEYKLSIDTGIEYKTSSRICKRCGREEIKGFGTLPHSKRRFIINKHT